MLITGAELADGRVRDVRVADGSIAAIDADPGAESDERVVDAEGKTLLPGAIDIHVHFREPDNPHKETWTTGSRSAAAGGVTTVVDQPNTSPPPISGEAFDRKTELASDSLVDWGINGGVTADWDPDSLFDRPLFALGEVFLADSTGDMGIAADLFREAVAAAAENDVAVTVHAEDETLFDDSVREENTNGGTGGDGDGGASGDAADGIGRDAAASRWSRFRTAEAEAEAVDLAVDVGTEAGGQIHIAHTSTPEGVDAAVAGDATCEVTPHHLYLSSDDADELGTYGRMNPPLRSEERREAVFQRVADGTVDVIATDHAPHTVAEKEADLWSAPSGVPGVETMLPLLLNSVREGDLSIERVRDLVASNPAEIFDLPRKGRIEEGNDADLVLVDLDAPREIRGDDLHSKCGWTPFEGWTGVFPELTTVRGHAVYERDPATGAESFGEPVGENVRE